MTDNCVCCGDILPEGRMVCPSCERAALRGTDKKSAICAYLKEHHTGKGRAIHSRDLQRLFSIDGRNLRRKISALRQDGYPICMLIGKSIKKRKTIDRVLDIFLWIVLILLIALFVGLGIKAALQ